MLALKRALLAPLWALLSLVSLSFAQEGSSAEYLEALQGWAKDNKYEVKDEGSLLVFRPKGMKAPSVRKLTTLNKNLWKSTTPQRQDPACFFLLRDGEEMRSLNLRIAELPGCEYLASFAADSNLRPSFLLRRPLVAGIQKTPDGVQEWSIPHEVTNFGARLLFLRQFGRQPLWFELGIGLWTQEEIHGDIYSFPFRAGFVGIGEHGGWEKPLKAAFKKFSKDKVPAFGLDQVTQYPLGTFDEERLARSWGLWRYLQTHDAEQVAALCAAVGKALRAGEYSGDDSDYTYNPNFQLTTEQQTELFQEHLGEDVFSRLSVYFESGEKGFKRAWKSYVAKREKQR